MPSKAKTAVQWKCKQRRVLVNQAAGECFFVSPYESELGDIIWKYPINGHTEALAAWLPCSGHCWCNADAASEHISRLLNSFLSFLCSKMELCAFG